VNHVGVVVEEGEERLEGRLERFQRLQPLGC
jgi:hypothetical protein